MDSKAMPGLPGIDEYLTIFAVQQDLRSLDALRNAIARAEGLSASNDPRATPAARARLDYGLGLMYRALAEAVRLDLIERKMAERFGDWRHGTYKVELERRYKIYDSLVRDEDMVDQDEGRIAFLVRAQALFESALNHFTVDKWPLAHAQVQQALGDLHWNWIGHPLDEMRIAFQHYKQAVAAWPPDADPAGFARLSTRYRNVKQMLGD